ncbi:MAG: UbiA-like polyprenyltransferase [Acidobacteriota bacterium]
MTAFFARLRTVLEMIKFQHTVFALPFAMLAMVWAAGGWPGWRVFLWILGAMVGARSAAMTFNRLADRRYDARNPRTQGWPLVTGEVSPAFAWLFLLASIGLLEISAWQLNTLCLALSPLALAVLLGYSLTKRFTVLCHFILGFADGISAPGAWIAVTATLQGSGPAWWLCGAMTFWIAGFDLLYALQDVDFDRAQGLHSFPARFGVVPALWLSAACHGFTVVLLGVAGLSAGAGPVFWAVVAAIAAALAWEHLLVRPGDLSRLNAAFFTVNGYVALGIFLGGLLDLWLARL